MCAIIQAGDYLSHPFLQPNTIFFREYQLTMGKNAAKQNTLVVLPTSLGKTIIALISMIEILDQNPTGRIFFLAPTRPLVLQHFQTFQDLLKPNLKCCLFSSNLSSKQRTLALNNHQIFFSTPQIIQNDIKGGMYSLAGISQIIFDETHKARKNYAYTVVAHHYLTNCPHPLVLGVTASPGSDLFRINELCQTLQIERIVFRERESRDIQKYIHPISSIFHNIDLPIEIFQAQSILDTAIRKIRDFLVAHEVLPKRNYTSKFQFIQLIQDLKKLEILLDSHAESYLSNANAPNVSEDMLNFPHLVEIFDPQINQHPPDKSMVFSRAINAIYLEHLKEILTTQDVRMVWKYLRKLRARAETTNPRVKRFLHSKYIQGIQKILKPTMTSPKIPVLLSIIAEELDEDPGAKFILFTQYREMGMYLTEALNNHPELQKQQIHAKRFVGQASRENDKGMSQQQQGDMIKDFKTGDFRILVATSVAEEGLDIPNVSAVIFYDMVPNEIRLIQRRGRTGRHKPGKCHFLINNNSLDSIYHAISHRKEEKMQSLLKNPKLVQTVEALPRSKEKPQYQVKSALEIDIANKNRKILREKQAIQEIQSKMQKSSPNNSPYMKMVSDMTIELTQHSIQHKSKHRETHSSQKARKFLTKWVFDWICSTMKVLGSHYKTFLYYPLDELYQTAQEEEIDPLKIQMELDYGVKNHAFRIKKNYVISKILVSNISDKKE